MSLLRLNIIFWHTWNKAVCGQWVPINGSGCLKHRASSTDGVVGPLPGKGGGGCRQALAMGRGPLGLLAQEQTCSTWIWPWWRPPHLKSAELVHHCLCPWVALNTLVSAVPRELVTIYTNWGSSPCVLYPSTENKISARGWNVLVWVNTVVLLTLMVLFTCSEQGLRSSTLLNQLLCVHWNTTVISAIKASAKLWYTPA